MPPALSEPTLVAALGIMLAVSGCDANSGGDLQTLRVGDDKVQIIKTGVPYAGGGDEALFLIAPYKDRPISERIAIAKASLKKDGECRLASEDPKVLRAMTARHTDGKNEQLLMAPITCGAQGILIN